MREQAYKPGSVPGSLQAATISLGRPSPDASSSLPGDSAGRLISPYVTLHQAGFAQVSGCPEPRALLPHDCTLTDDPQFPLSERTRGLRPPAVCFCGTFLGVAPHWVLPSALPCGARTFLCRLAPAAIARPAPAPIVASGRGGRKSPPLWSGVRFTARRYRRCAPGFVPPEERPSPVFAAP